MTKVWHYGFAKDEGIGAGASTCLWETNTFKNVISVANTNTVLRTRMTGHMKFSVTVLPAGTGSYQTEWYEGMQVQFGLYCKPSLSSVGSPPGVTANTSDGFWVQRESMVPKTVIAYLDKAGGQHQEVTYEFPEGVSQSFGQRGPYTVAGAVFLCWSIISFNPFYLLNSTDYQGAIGGAIEVYALLDHV